jgi:hypothetical protein
MVTWTVKPTIVVPVTTPDVDARWSCPSVAVDSDTRK